MNPFKKSPLDESLIASLARRGEGLAGIVAAALRRAEELRAAPPPVAAPSPPAWAPRPYRVRDAIQFAAESYTPPARGAGR